MLLAYDLLVWGLSWKITLQLFQKFKTFSLIIHMELDETELAHCAPPTPNPVCVSKVITKASGKEGGYSRFMCVQSRHCMECGLDGVAQVWP